MDCQQIQEFVKTTKTRHSNLKRYKYWLVAALLVPALLITGCGPLYGVTVEMPMMGKAQMKTEITIFYRWLQENGRLLNPNRPESEPKELDPKTLKPVPDKPEPPMPDEETIKKRLLKGLEDNPLGKAVEVL